MEKIHCGDANEQLRGSVFTESHFRFQTHFLTAMTVLLPFLHCNLAYAKDPEALSSSQGTRPPISILKHNQVVLHCPLYRLVSTERKQEHLG